MRRESNYGPDQWQELTALINSLRQCNEASVRTLITLRELWPNEYQRARTAECIVGLADQVNSAVNQLEQLRVEAQEQGPTEIVIRVQMVCISCRHRENTIGTGEQADPQEAKVELLHQSLWPTLHDSSHTLRAIQQHVFATVNSGQRWSKTLHAALAHLGKAFLRERKYLKKFVPRQVAKIRVETGDDKCASCGRTSDELNECEHGQKTAAI